MTFGSTAIKDFKVLVKGFVYHLPSLERVVDLNVRVSFGFQLHPFTLNQNQHDQPNYFELHTDVGIHPHSSTVEASCYFPQ